MLIWPRVVCGSTAYHLAHLVVRVFPSCLGTGDWWWPGVLLVSPFNVKWRCSAQAGGVEGSKFCLFSVALPARCVSSVSPRFHFRRHAFCFLLLATILENPQCFFSKNQLLILLILYISLLHPIELIFLSYLIPFLLFSLSWFFFPLLFNLEIS
jgi:hypothetical protein